MTDSKLGLYLCYWTNEAEKFAECQPAVMKTQDHNPDRLARFRAISPGTLWIGRVVMEGFDFRSHFNFPDRAAEKIRDIIMANLKGCRYDVLEGICEPNIDSEESAKSICELNIHLARLLRAEGFQYAAYSFSATRPDINYWPLLRPALWSADYLAMHAYGPGPLLHESYWYLLNYGLSWAALGEEIRKSLKGILLTEFGVARGLLGGPDVGYKAPPGESDEEYLTELIRADKELDSYIKGATIFQIGNRADWRTFGVEQLLPGLESHVRNFYCAGKKPDSGKNEEEPRMEDLGDKNLIHALDVSEYGGPIKDSQWKAAYEADFRLAIVQAWGGGPIPGGKNARCAQQLEGARKAGMMTAIYIWLPPDTTTKTELLIQAAKDAAGSEYQHVKFVAMDIEDAQLRLLHPLDPKARLFDAISHIKDKPVIIYTSRYMWSKVIGDVTGFEQYCALWDARYDKLADLDANWEPYGGWKERAIKQYQGTTTVAGGISADLNVVHLERLTRTNNATNQDTRIQEVLKKIEAAQATFKAGYEAGMNKLNEVKEDLDKWEV